MFGISEALREIIGVCHGIMILRSVSRLLLLFLKLFYSTPSTSPSHYMSLHILCGWVGAGVMDSTDQNLDVFKLE